MYTPFMKKLATDTSAEEISRIKTILGQNGIKFEVMIARGRSGSRYESHTNLRSSPVMYGVAPESMFIYTVYVRRKDFGRARQLVLGM